MPKRRTLPRRFSLSLATAACAALRVFGFHAYSISRSVSHVSDEFDWLKVSRQNYPNSSEGQQRRHATAAQFVVAGLLVVALRQTPARELQQTVLPQRSTARRRHRYWPDHQLVWLNDGR